MERSTYYDILNYVTIIYINNYEIFLNIIMMIILAGIFEVRKIKVFLMNKLINYKIIWIKYTKSSKTYK